MDFIFSLFGRKRRRSREYPPLFSDLKSNIQTFLQQTNDKEAKLQQTVNELRAKVNEIMIKVTTGIGLITVLTGGTTLLAGVAAAAVGGAGLALIIDFDLRKLKQLEEEFLTTVKSLINDLEKITNLCQSLLKYSNEETFTTLSYSINNFLFTFHKLEVVDDVIKIPGSVRKYKEVFGKFKEIREQMKCF